MRPRQVARAAAAAREGGPFSPLPRLAGKRRVARFMEKHLDAKPVISEVHHYAMLAFLRVARDDEGELHLATSTRIDEESWTELV